MAQASQAHYSSGAEAGAGTCLPCGRVTATTRDHNRTQLKSKPRELVNTFALEASSFSSPLQPTKTVLESSLRSPGVMAHRTCVSPSAPWPGSPVTVGTPVRALVKVGRWLKCSQINTAELGTELRVCDKETLNCRRRGPGLALMPLSLRFAVWGIQRSGITG